MSGKNYYALVAGLREYAPDAENKGFDISALREEIFAALDAGDARSARLLYTCFDCENIANIRRGSSAFNALGLLSREEAEEELLHPSRLPRRIAQVLRAYADPEGEDAEEVDTTQRFEKSLFEAYYEECAGDDSLFLRRWSEFDRTLRNILAATVARQEQRPVDEAIIGGGDAAEQMRRSSAADFGLKGEYEFADAVVAAVSDERNLLEKERKIDNVRWTQAEELSTFAYFDIDAVLAYMVKVNMVARWSLLDPARGREMFERLMAGLDGKARVAAVK
ncbi:MAG: DUF2764 family protein [Alistipes sp.]|nr:DUF2764 family protein [Alistipes sp.]